MAFGGAAASASRHGSFALILVTVLPLIALSTFAILRTVNDERSQIERDVRERAENLLADVNREIRSVQVSLEILASSPTFSTATWKPLGTRSERRSTSRDLR